MPPRIHSVAGNGEIVTLGVVDIDDEGAPPPMPPGGRIYKDAEIDAAATSPANEFELAAKRDAAAAKLAARPSAPAASVATAGALVAPPPVTGREIRLRCLDIATRSGETDPVKVLAAAREMFSFVENG